MHPVEAIAASLLLDESHNSLAKSDKAPFFSLAFCLETIHRDAGGQTIE